MNYLTEPLYSKHRRKEFLCGKKLLDNYLHYQASQDVKRKLSACFILIDTETELIKGYYTLSNNSIPLDLVPPGFKKKLPVSYSAIPTTLLGRLAIDTRFQGRGIGKILLIDALKRSFETAKIVGSYAVVVDPIDADAGRFYEKYGFVKLPDSGKMFIPMKTVKELFDKG